MMEDSFYKAFLEELNSLEMFRMGYISRHKDVPLDREDPEIRRLIEALAFFSARIRLAGQKSISSVRRRLFQQFFPYLMTPLPSMAMISANPTRRLTEPMEFPAGFELIIISEGERRAFFRTLYPLQVLPAEIDRIYMVSYSDRYRLIIKIRSFFPIFKSTSRLSFFINHLDDFEASLKLFDLLERHIIKVSVSFEDKISETTEGIPCQFAFGADGLKEFIEVFNPLEQERLYFHFPWQDLFFNIFLPEEKQHGWETLFLIIDLSAQWPKNLTINKDIFNLFSVPIINLWDYDAEPIFCDGTRESYFVQHPEPEYEFELHSIKGVYEILNSEMIPIRPGIFSPRDSSFYEIEEKINKNDRRKHYIYLNIPDAFDNPRVVNIEARWFQPWFSSILSERISVIPYKQSLEGINWDLAIFPIPHFRSSFWDETESFLHLLTLLHKNFLDREDILDILSSLGSIEGSPFKRVLEGLDKVNFEKKAHGYDVKYSYGLKFSDTIPSDPSLIEKFVKHVQNILDAWLSNTLVEVKLER